MACTVAQIEANAAIAVRTGTKFAGFVIVVKNRREMAGNRWAIDFTIRGDASARTYSETWGDETAMWVACPSDIQMTSTPDNVGAAPAIGATGKLYLSAAFITRYQLGLRPKWPVELDGPLPSETLSIFPHSLRLIGIELLSGNFNPVTVELLDPSQAAREQAIVLDERSLISVKLTDQAIGAAGLPFYPDEEQLIMALETLKGDRKDRKQLAFAWSVVAATAVADAAGARTPARGSSATREALDAFLYRG